MPGVCQVSACLPFLPRSRSPREHVIDTLRSDGSKSGRNLNSTQIPNNTLTFHFTRDACSSSPPPLLAFTPFPTSSHKQTPRSSTMYHVLLRLHSRLKLLIGSWKREAGAEAEAGTRLTCAFDICSEFACVHCHAQRLTRIPLATTRAYPAVL